MSNDKPAGKRPSLMGLVSQGKQAEKAFKDETKGVGSDEKVQNESNSSSSEVVQRDNTPTISSENREMSLQEPQHEQHAVFVGKGSPEGIEKFFVEIHALKRERKENVGLYETVHSYLKDIKGYSGADIYILVNNIIIHWLVEHEGDIEALERKSRSKKRKFTKSIIGG